MSALISKLKTIAWRVRGASFQRLNQNIQAIHNETGKNRLLIFLDMIWCTAKYGIGYLDYHVFGFAVNKGKKRRTFMTMHHNLGLTRLVNDSSLNIIMNDKLLFMENYHDFVGRRWLDVRKVDADILKAFCKECGTVFVKPTSSYGGVGVERITYQEDTDYAELLNRLLENKQYLADEAVVQHPVMNQLFPGSVNTVRIATLVANGDSHFLYALQRIGSGNNHVDNVSSGGMYTKVGKDGMLEFPAFCDKTGLFYDVHPVTGTPYIGFEIPMFKEAVELCLKAAKVNPGLGYIGWDVAITPAGPVLIEGNILPGYDMVQNAKFHPDGQGLLPIIEEILGRPVPLS